MTEKELTVIELTEENIESMVYEIRGQKVMLDFELARIYGYTTKRFNEQVKRNIEKFPENFMFQLTIDEVGQLSKCNFCTMRNSVAELEENSWSQKSTLKNNSMESEKVLRCQNVTLNKSGDKRGYNIKYLPYAFTEQGIYMLMTVLKGELAVKQSKALIRLFKRMKDYLVSSNNLTSINEVLKLSNQVNKNTSSIERIEEKLDVVMDNFIDPSTYKQFVFLSGERLEADVAYQFIYSQAKKSIHIIDDYIDVKTLHLLRIVNKDIEITILSDNKSKNSLTKEFVEDFTNQCSNKLKLIKTNNKCHDRFIIIDYKEDNERVYLCGSSSKDAGKRATTINQVSSGYLYHPLVEALLNSNELVLL